MKNLKRDLIWIAAVAVAIPLALSFVNAQAQEADDLPRLGETTAEYEARTARTQGDRTAAHEALGEAQEKAHREALRASQEKVEALREAQEKAYREALREAQERQERASKLHGKAIKDLAQTIKDQKPRAENARQIR
jgi:hypothetical protein